MSLEPTSPPSPGPRRPRGAARLATAADLPAIARLERRCFARGAWSGEALAGELAEPHALVLLCEAAGPPGRVEGYVSLRRVEDEGELLRIAVLPGRRRRGLGRWLLASGLDALRRGGATRCTLEVRADNVAALALYRRAGFGEIHRRRGYYRDGGDAVILALDLGSSA